MHNPDEEKIAINAL